MIKIKRIKNIIQFIVMIITVLLCTIATYFKSGILGYYPDLMYHILRIEGMKEAILSGNAFSKIYANFYGGFGYGSPMFYPDIFLIIPASLRIAGFSPEISYKFFIAIVCIAIMICTFLSYRYITKSNSLAIVGVYVQTLSMYYLANVINRIGMSEYIAFIFLPILMAAIYDFFEYDAKKWYLFIVAFSGLLLSHLITTLLAAIVTFIIFFTLLFFKSGKKAIFDRLHLEKLFMSAIIIIGITAFFLFPLLEQMFGDMQFKYSTPTTKLVYNVEPFKLIFSQKGYFCMIAYVGIGIPVFVLLSVRLFSKTRDKWENIFLVFGLLLWISASIKPIWSVLSDTFLNMIQFPYRVYSLALSMMVCGGLLVLRSFKEDHKNIANSISYFVIVLSVAFAIREDILQSKNDINNISEELLLSENYWVGQGEWLPKDIDKLGPFPNSNLIVGTDISYKRELYSTNGYFDAPSAGTYVVPVIGYKGYEAYVECGAEMDKTDIEFVNGLIAVKIDNPGRVYVKYTGTAIQKFGYMTSITTLIIILFILLKSRIYLGKKIYVMEKKMNIVIEKSRNGIIERNQEIICPKR